MDVWLDFVFECDGEFFSVRILLWLFAAELVVWACHRIFALKKKNFPETG